MSGSDTSGSDEVRILHSISETKSATRASAPAARGRGGRIAAVAVLMLLLIGVGVLVWHGGADSAAPVAAAPPQKSPPLLAAAEPSPVAAAPSASTPPVASADTAVINDTAPVGAQPEASPSQTQLTNALEEGVKPPPATLKNALEAKPERPVRQQAAQEEKKKKPAKAQPKHDSDVDLIKALVARTPEADKKGQARESASGAPARKLAQNDAAAAAKHTGGRNVDVVERSGKESTESLLQRCHALGFIEGEFCRWRICSGRWDSDAACKVANSN
ncbi:hypothetical protein [Herbaspirillum frisingense]|uniref:hypothetical protein n=1 Tax=Herbaspirillum frisingense TaxID=92645 RepID=UPI001F2BE6DF|nr:hypothetical protein [Herbaspirillum frisingense]UIN21231.1 hypothetical protein LAZ82_22720 [Herbaspirillum frisingense]